MQKILNITTALGIMFTSVSGAMASENPLHTQTDGKSVSITHTNDFISCLSNPLPSLPTDKGALLKELDSLTADITNNRKMATAFNILFKSSSLTASEKADWLKKNYSKLPTPFMLLMVLFEEDLETAKNLYMITGARINIDCDMCHDKSVSSGVMVLKQIVLPKIYEKLGIKTSEDLLPIEKSFFKQGGFERFDAEYKVSYTPPYWLAFHGMAAMLNAIDVNEESSQKSLFKSENQYSAIKEAAFKEMEGFAAKRQNLG